MTAEIMDAHIKLCAYRAIQVAIRTQNPTTTPSSMIKEGDEIYVFHKTTNKSVNVDGIAATVIATRENYVECRRSTKGRTMRVAYEHIRLIPSNKLAKAITETYLEDDIANENPHELKSLKELEVGKEKDIYSEIFGDDSDLDEEEELKPIGSASTILSKTAIGDTAKEVGHIENKTSIEIGNKELQSIHDHKLK